MSGKLKLTFKGLLDFLNPNMKLLMNDSEKKQFIEDSEKERLVSLDYASTYLVITMDISGIVDQNH